RVAKALQDAGYQNLTVGSDILNEGRMRIAVQRKDGLPTERNGVLGLLSVDDRHGDPSVRVEDAPVMYTDYAWGGMRNKKGSTPWCTSGWTVEDSSSALWGTTA